MDDAKKLIAAMEADTIQTESMAEWLLVMFLNHLRRDGDVRAAASWALTAYFDLHDDTGDDAAREVTP